MPSEYQATLRSHLYFADVFAKGQQEVPGRMLAEDIAAAFRNEGYESAEVVDESPLWQVRLIRPSGPRIDVTVFVYEPHANPAQAVWSVSVDSQRGPMDRLLRRPEPRDVVTLVKHLDRVLRELPGTMDLRWFKRLPAEPYRAHNFSHRPIF